MKASIKLAAAAAAGLALVFLVWPKKPSQVRAAYYIGQPVYAAVELPSGEKVMRQGVVLSIAQDDQTAAPVYGVAVPGGTWFLAEEDLAPFSLAIGA